MHNYLLAIDTGNTRTKWAIFNALGAIQLSGVQANTDLLHANLWPEDVIFERIIIANVAGEKLHHLLEQKLQSQSAPIVWAQSTPEACSVRNDYSPPHSLGCDRWAALIAAWQITQNSCLVVNAGTAVTIDALEQQPTTEKNQAVFIGGLILPGLYLMQKSLTQATARLTQPNHPTFTDIFAKNTATAMDSGALHAILGAISLMAHALQQKNHPSPSIILSGGDAQSVQAHLPDPLKQQSRVIEPLVLQGLYFLYINNQTIAQENSPSRRN